MQNFENRGVLEPKSRYSTGPKSKKLPTKVACSSVSYLWDSGSSCGLKDKRAGCLV